MRLIRHILSRTHSHGSQGCFAVLVATWLCTVAPAAGQTVQGRVTDHHTGEPVADATVLLLTESGSVRSMGLTDPDGAYSIIAPGPGKYSVRVDAAGYNTLTINNRYAHSSLEIGIPK